MQVTVKRKGAAAPLPISTEYIKLESAMKLANLVPSGGGAKLEIQQGNVTVNGEVCTQRGRKLRPGDCFAFQGARFTICENAAE